MQKFNAYLHNAEECRSLADDAESDEIRNHFLKLAELWLLMARDQVEALDRS
jgi:hypothetical protein